MSPPHRFLFPKLVLRVNNIPVNAERSIGHLVLRGVDTFGQYGSFTYEC